MYKKEKPRRVESIVRVCIFIGAKVGVNEYGSAAGMYVCTDYVCYVYPQLVLFATHEGYLPRSMLCMVLWLHSLIDRGHFFVLR